MRLIFNFLVEKTLFHFIVHLWVTGNLIYKIFGTRFQQFRQKIIFQQLRAVLEPFEKLKYHFPSTIERLADTASLMLHSFEKNLGQPAMGLEDLIRQEVHGLALADHDLIPRALEVRDLFLVTLDLQ